MPTTPPTRHPATSPDDTVVQAISRLVGGLIYALPAKPTTELHRAVRTLVTVLTTARPFFRSARLQRIRPVRFDAVCDEPVARLARATAARILYVIEHGPTTDRIIEVEHAARALAVVAARHATLACYASSLRSTDDEDAFYFTDCGRCGGQLVTVIDNEGCAPEHCAACDPT